MQWLMALIAGLMGFGAIAMAFAGDQSFACYLSRAVPRQFGNAPRQEGVT